MATASFFQDSASYPKNALALIYDLEGFSRFFNQPDVHEYVPQFLNTVQRALDVVINGGQEFWGPDKEVMPPMSLKPVHFKFLGDGGLYLWTGVAEKPITAHFVQDLCNRLWNLQNNFDEVVAASHDRVPVVDVPNALRIGIARGAVYELKTVSGANEYIGFCINLASRLQSYCPGLGFIASARLGLPKDMLDKYGYTRVVAKAIKGFPREIVIVDKAEFEDLNPSLREQYFDRAPGQA